MSLRDALLKSGAVDKKAKQQADRALKQARKREQAQQQRKRDLERAAREQAAAAAQDAEAARMARRVQRQEERADATRQLRVRHLISHHRLPLDRGEVRFFHKDVDGRRLHKLRVPTRIAEGLRQGALGIACLESPDADPEYVVLAREPAERVAALDPRVVVFLPDLADDLAADPALGWADEDP